MDAKHTPGPWEVCGKLQYEPRIHIMKIEGRFLEIGDDISCIALIPLNHPEAEANARLIAAAPDLLAALEQIAGEGADDNVPLNKSDAMGMRKIAREAIAKAKETP